MATFIMLTRLSHEGLKSPGSLADLSHEDACPACPQSAWLACSPGGCRGVRDVVNGIELDPPGGIETWMW